VKEWACKPDSVLRQPRPPKGRSFIWADGCPPAQAPYPPLITARAKPCASPQEPATRGLLGLAGGGVCRAVPVTRDAVSSYLTFSPLPDPAGQNPASHRRSVFCGTFPRVAPGRRYRPPCPTQSGLSSRPAAAAEIQPSLPAGRPPGPLFHAIIILRLAGQRGSKICGESQSPPPIRPTHAAGRALPRSRPPGGLHFLLPGQS